MTSSPSPGSTAPAPETAREALEDLARSVHAARPDWGVKGTLSILEALASETDLRTLRTVALEAARDRRYRSPIGIRWRLEDQAVGSARVDDTAPCGVCGKPRARCEYDRPLVTSVEAYDDHVYEAPLKREAATRRR